jgi:hypothetical protein
MGERTSAANTRPRASAQATVCTPAKVRAEASIAARACSTLSVVASLGDDAQQESVDGSMLSAPSGAASTPADQ